MRIDTGTTDISIDVRIVDDAGAPVTGLTASTFPPVVCSKGTGADIVLSLNDLGTLSSSHNDGGVKERGHGAYRLDLPDSVATAAVPQVLIRGESTGKHLMAAGIQVGSAQATAQGLTDAVAAIRRRRWVLNTTTNVVTVYAADGTTPDFTVQLTLESGQVKEYAPL